MRIFGDCTGVLLVLIFLVHDALVSLDAVFRSSYRRAISRQRLLEWETAAEAELGIHKRTSLDLYLDCTPVIASAHRRRAVPGAAACVLGCTADTCALGMRPANLGVARPASSSGAQWVAAADKIFLRLAALHTWRYFAEFSSAQHHWLVPDSVQEEPAKIAARVSPTNLGFLLNARQIACELGYLTVPEFVEQTQRTLDTMSRMRVTADISSTGMTHER